MLDQNTDRIYWVIGGVIVVGALIAVAKLVIPDVFTSIMDYFKSQIPF